MRTLIQQTAVMSPRSIRRAAEREARKLEMKRAPLSATAARHDEAAFLSEPKIHDNDPAEREARKLEMKREQQPGADDRATSSARSAEERPSSLTTVKTTLTGRTVLLHSGDAEAYRRHIAAYETEYRPVGLRECQLVQSLADTQWRLNRIPGLEAGIYALGQLELQAEDEPGSLSLAKTQHEVRSFLKYEKQLRSLQLQESRLLRRYLKEVAEFHALQKQRHDEMASNFQIADNISKTRNPDSEPEASAPPLRTDRSDEAAVLSAPKTQTSALNLQIPKSHPSPRIDSFALPSSPCGNFSALANVD